MLLVCLFAFFNQVAWSGGGGGGGGGGSGGGGGGGGGDQTEINNNWEERDQHGLQTGNSVPACLQISNKSSQVKISCFYHPSRVVPRERGIKRGTF